jgi:glyoxylase-like metal-dependent hydrolase (beta-lactamase superfamily II)
MSTTATATETPSATSLRTGIPGLFASRPRSLPFAPELDVRAFLLQREAGNILLYAVEGLERESAAFEQLGGVSRRYLNHGHEAMFAAGGPPAPLFLHEADRAAAERHVEVRGTFSRRHRLDDDFEVIPTPGHTPGATAYLWDSGRQRLLFTGDTIELSEGEWIAGLLESSDRDAYVESLELIRELEFDVLVPWAASAGQPFYALTDPADARARIGTILRRVRDGGRR